MEERQDVGDVSDFGMVSGSHAAGDACFLIAGAGTCRVIQPEGGIQRPDQFHRPGRRGISVLADDLPRADACAPADLLVRGEQGALQRR